MNLQVVFHVPASAARDVFVSVESLDRSCAGWDLAVPFDSLLFWGLVLYLFFGQIGEFLVVYLCASLYT
jgi:hypothetical protein